MKIRRVDTIFGALFILIAGGAATLFILHTLNNIPTAYLATYNEVPGT
ncbi:MAG TPA: hypothetical protein VGN56_00415 [Candidatus Paceibacterota bacterium]|jgi:hypothetical protein|nr:hypothetical protein [Candidatus Paceibacterota bacterium]